MLWLICLNLFSVSAADNNIDPPPFTSHAGQLFKAVWSLVDGPIVAEQAHRSWLFGPGPLLTNPLKIETETYLDSPGGKRSVLYFDKARLELNSPLKQYVTNGLLVYEMISGKKQTGDNSFSDAPQGAARLNVVGDGNNWLTYASLQPYASLNLDHRAPDRTGQSVDQQLTEKDGLQPATNRAGQQSLAYFDSVLGHNIPKVFWDFFNQTGPVYNPLTGNYVQGQPVNWLADIGYPLTEPYWVRQFVAGVERDVLFQAFQRRVLTFTPDNPPAYQVEMGNVGRHYFQWNYGLAPGPNSNWSAPASLSDSLSEVVRGKTGRKQVAITLDAGSTAVAFPQEMTALDRYGVKITFFLTGRWVTDNPIYAQLIANSGMEVANHTYSHPDLTTFTDDQVNQEITGGANTILRYTGQNPRPLFRFPYGARTDHELNLLNNLGYRSVYWTYDSLDSVGDPKSAAFLISRITGLSDTELDGAIILMHLGNLSSGEALGPILENLQSRGFKVVTVSQLIS